MSYKKFTGILGGALGLLLALSLILAPAVMAMPQNGHVTWGTVTVQGDPAAEGTQVSALVNGRTFSTTVDDQGEYSLLIGADDPETGAIEGGANGNVITFSIGINTADLYVVATSETPATFPFAIGGANQINLSTEEGYEPAPLVADAGGPYAGNTGAAISITGSASGGTAPYTYAWDLDNDGQYDDAATASTSYTWSTTGIKTIGLWVTDDASVVDTDTATVTVTASDLVADAGGPYAGNTGASITITGSAAGGVTPYTYAWDLDNDSQYDDAATAATSHTWSTAGTYTISLQVTDAELTVDTDTATVTVTNAGGGGGGGSAGTTDSTDTSGIVNDTGVFTESITAHSNDNKVELTVEECVIGLTRLGTPITRLIITPMTYTPTPPAQSSVIGLPYNLAPEGATFDPAATVKFTYDPANLPAGVSEENLVLAFYDTATRSWVTLTDIIVDPVNHTVSGKTTHFTAFAVISGTTPAAFTASNLVVAPAAVDTGDAASAKVTISNTGDITGTYDVVLKINGTTVETKSITVAGKNSTDVTFTVSQQTAGTYTVSVGELSAVLTVNVPPTSTPPVSTSTVVVTTTSKPPDTTTSVIAPASTTSTSTTPASTTPASTTPTSTTVPDKKGINWPLIGGIGSGVIVVALIIVFIARRRD